MYGIIKKGADFMKYNVGLDMVNPGCITAPERIW